MLTSRPLTPRSLLQPQVKLGRNYKLRMQPRGIFSPQVAPARIARPLGETDFKQTALIAAGILVVGVALYAWKT